MNHVLQFSYTKAHLSEIFDRVAGSHRVYEIRNQRRPNDTVSLISTDKLRVLLLENEILADKALMKRIEESRKLRKAGKLVRYIPRSQRASSKV